MTIVEQMMAVLDNADGKIVSKAEIVSRLFSEYATAPSSVLHTDHCYNRINVQTREPYIFEFLENGKYRYLGPNYLYEGDVFWHPKGQSNRVKVGFWVKGERTLTCTLTNEQYLLQSEDDGRSFVEGQEAYRLHRTIERNSKLSLLKKTTALDKKGRLSCEACGFDFHSFYGDRGKGFIECHHNIPISEAEREREVSLDELTLLCSNCHRMIHRQRPWLSVEHLEESIRT